jgi:uncharacterized membrane protein
VRAEGDELMTAAKDLIAALAPRRRPAEGRVGLIDAARGAAILAMVVYHVAWDLYFLGFIALDITSDPGWVFFQRAIVVSFLLLVGVSLTLAHGEGIRWSAFGRRVAVIVAAALLVTVGTYIALPDYFVFFGVLHAIALFSVLGIAFVRLPWWVTGLASLLVLLPPAFITDPVMSQRPLSWIGFWPTPPMTTDIVPIFPWFGIVLIGIAATKLIMRSPAWAGAFACLALHAPVLLETVTRIRRRPAGPSRCSRRRGGWARWTAPGRCLRCRWRGW